MFNIKSICKFCLIVAILSLSTLPAFATERSAEQNALIVARYLVDQAGIDVRDTHYSGFLRKGSSEHMTVTLYSGNEYFLVASGCDDAKDVDIKVYDENGNLIAKDSDTDKTTYVSFTPAWTGTFIVKITMYDSTSNGAHWLYLIGYQ